MGKTYRYDPEAEDRYTQDHRIPRNQRRRAQRAVTRIMRPHLPPVVLVQSEVPEFVDIRRWIPARETGHVESLLRQSRLDILQTLGEFMLETGIELA